MKPNDVFDELQNCQEDVPIFRKLISITPLHDRSASEGIEEWQMVLAHIVEIISSNSELGNDRILLATNAFYALLSARCTSQFLNIAVQFQALESHDLCFLDKQYTVCDLELFKLLNAYGYLQTNQTDMAKYDALFLMIDQIYINCITYTKYSYFAYKVLYIWLKRFQKMSDVAFQRENDCIIERKLEAIIFTNWSNAINDICKQNAQIFNIYLQIMSQKYGEAFLVYMFKKCCNCMSWQNETKYNILAEIFQVQNALKLIMSSNISYTFQSRKLFHYFIYSLCIALTRNSLRCGSTRVYLVMLRKLDKNEWKIWFKKIIKLFIHRWESGEHEDHGALQSLCKYWLEPTIKMYRDFLPLLWKLSNQLQGYFFRSYLQRIAAELHIDLQVDDIENYMKDKEEIIRLNAFAVVCHCAGDLIDINKENPFSLIKQFLWFNANAATVFMREGIIKYFKTFISSILKMISTEADCPQSIYEFMEWLHEYFLDCFEIGSCYQRKILALNLYKTLLSFMNQHSQKNCARHGECLRCITVIDKHLKTSHSWRFTNKESLFILLRLVLDSALDVTQLATTLILEYFEKDILSITEKQVLYDCGWEHCNSSKFYKIESGAAFIKIIAHWSPLNETSKDVPVIFSNAEHNILSYSSYSKFLLDEARCQLAQVKSDILKAIVQNRPFYGILTALLTIAFRNGPENWILTSLFTEEVLNLLKDAINFFLSALSTEASTTDYSSSFAEMGLAINEKIKTSEVDNSNYDELQLSPAHQMLMSCIWMSLKVSCEIVSEIGMLAHSDAQVKCSMDIIVTVLLKCRHKGVIESAGVAIANLSRCLYNKKEYSELPKTYLTRLLEEDMEKSLHLTRRGAGLSIMFHRLVVSDNRRDRPMAHLAVQMLLRSLKNSMTAVENVEVGDDSPWAKRLHFLRALVADKEIHSQLVMYMEDICLTCFKYMESDVWTVRNASLQLYGAVVPRLVGQCSGRGSGALDFGNGYSVNHFMTHFPKLKFFIWIQLWKISKMCGTSNVALRSYSSIVHILILLSKLSTNDGIFDYPTKECRENMKYLLRDFLGNPMIHVRQLVAKAYTALTAFSFITLEIENAKKEIENTLSTHDANTLHGYLLISSYLKEKLIEDDIHFETPENIDTSNLTDELSKFMYFTGNTMQSCYMFVGYWARLYAIDTKCWIPINESNPQSNESNLQLELRFDQHYVYHILNSNCPEIPIEFLKGLSHWIPLLEFILRYLMSIKNKRHQLVLDEMVTFTLKTIKHASLEINWLSSDSGSIDQIKLNKPKFDKITEEFNQIEMTVANSYMIPVKNSLILAFSNCKASINEVLSHVLDLCMDEKESVRLRAVEYIEITLHSFQLLNDRNQLTIMQCCLILLKDEIAEIRKIVSMLVQKYTNSSIVHYTLQHEEIVYEQILSNILNLQSDVDNVDFMRYFTCAIKDVGPNTTIENPFNHDDDIFYKEESKFLNLCFLYNSRSQNCDIREDHVAIHAIQTRGFRKLQEKAGFSYDDLRTILYLKDVDYFIRKRDSVAQQQK
nr:PREDICTED: uncharacterized protein LOC105675675 isoform X2 [Linepithema humile]